MVVKPARKNARVLGQGPGRLEPLVTETESFPDGTKVKVKHGGLQTFLLSMLPDFNFEMHPR